MGIAACLPACSWLAIWCLSTQLPHPCQVHKESISADGTRKWLIEVSPGVRVETVFIPETSTTQRQRGVLCVSSQAGCSLDCSFCATVCVCVCVFVCGSGLFWGRPVLA